MKAKRVFLCLMLLVLGASSAWADKYYQPGPYQGNITPRLTLEQAVGQKFMIYNTAIDGGVDRTGFLRNNGVQFELDKTKERDLFVYNESFVYTMEAYDDNADGVNDWYAIKSVSTGLYVNAAGKTDIGSASDAKLYISDWDNATGKSGVNMESWKYNVIANGQITSGGHGSTVFVVKNFNGGNRPYWNGTVNAFDTWSDGHPFAFYIANEVTGGEYLQDLHIYSRVDIFSAQQTYGYVQYADQITASPSYTEEGGFGDLIDGEATTYNVTNWNDNVVGHYYQIDLRTSVESLYLYMQCRADGLNAPTKYELQASADGNSYTKIGEYETNLASKAFYTSPEIELNGSYRYLRIVARQTSTSGYNCMGLSELYVLPTTKEVEDVVGYINAVQSSPLYTKATAKVYAALVEEYNRLYSDVRLLSGVPIPGNKYRIYADTYDRTNQRYVNREIMANSEGLLVKAPGAYHAADADGKKQHEWYCEQTTDGYLVFRNVADPTKYLAFGGVADTPYKWSINTVETNHYGVPLKNLAQQYLAVFNDGTYWQGDVTAAQDQHQSYTYTIPGNTEDADPDNDEDRTEKIEGGICTDFLFIPVPLDETEKKVTITADELAQRNSRLLYNGEVYPLPFSRTFKKRDGNWENQPTMQLLCSKLHSYVGVKVNDGGTLATTPKITYDEATSTLSFNLEEIANGDVLDIQLQIAQPFEIMAPALDVTKTPSLYLIRNKHQQGLAQQARPNRANVNIGIGDDGEGGPISSQTGKRYYAKFNQRNADMELVEGTPDWTLTEFEATSLFYFTETEDTAHDEYYSVNIHNATTVMKCADHAAWNTNGNTWFVQPKNITNNYGYNIGRSTLNANNNPGQVWGCNHEDGNKISMYKTGSAGNRVEIKANDDGTAWEFVKVDDAKAKTMLKEFIDKVAVELNDALDKKATQEGIDATKVQYYRFIVNTMKERAAGYYDGSFSTPGDNATAKLLQFAQNIHMVEHEIQYALYELPELSEDVVGVLSQLDNAEQPHWYYIRNVNGVVDGKDSYASFNGNNAPMALQQYAASDDKKLANLFYVVGEKNSYAPVMDSDPDNNGLYHDFPGNNLIVDEYLKVHVHNFMAKEVTLVSKNVQLDTLANYFPGQGQQTVMEGMTLKSNEDWSIELEYDLAGNTSFNAYGSCLLAGSKDPTKDNYAGEFQVYLKDDRSIVIKVNNADDRYRFWHTQDYFSHIKVVITYSQKTVTLDVYNSLGEKESMTISNVTLNDVSKLTSALPAEGAKITSLKTYQVEAMTWKTHEEVAGDANKDEWYIMPSSNVNHVGLAIVLGEPNDNKMGWTNGEGSDTYITTDLGTADNSTWKFVRVTDFDAHIDELLAMYNFEDCVIYDRELAKLMTLIQRNEAIIKAYPSGAGEEAAFNEVYYAFLNYDGPMPKELKAPKAATLYTIRPAVEESTGNALLVHIDKGNGTYATKEMYNGDVLRNDNSYDTRAVWMFDGKADGNFLALNGLTVKNIHTQCYMTALGDAASLVDEEGAAEIALSPLGACTTMFKVGGAYMNRAGVNATINYSGENATEFWGSAVTASTALQAVIDENRLTGTLHCKSTGVQVGTAGNVVVTLTYEGGGHKMNVLGTELLDNSGKVRYSAYEYKTAGDNPKTATYTLAGVLPGVYTLNCYVYDPATVDDLSSSNGKIDIEGIAAVSGVAKVINTGTAETKWIVEEIKDPETNVYYETSTNTNGHSTLMLGFNSLIPEGVEAFYSTAHDGKILDEYYLSMKSYGEPTDTVRILPAVTPVILRNTDKSIESKNFRFYYTAKQATPVEDDFTHGSLYFKPIKCNSFDEAFGSDVNIYMLHKENTDVRMYWVWENYDENGNQVGENMDVENGEGYVLCHANKSFIVLPYNEVGGVSMFSFRFTGSGGTSIEGVELEPEAEYVEAIYDLQGRKLSEITQPGIYIINGKKVMVR